MMINTLDARDRPPSSIKDVYKKYQRLTLEAIRSDPSVLDFRRGLDSEQQSKVRKIGIVPQSSVEAACSHLAVAEAHRVLGPSVDVPVYESEAVPGEPYNAQGGKASLFVIDESGLLLLPALVPERTQQDLVSLLLHRDLADQRHRTNVHLHHLLPYQAAQPEKSGLSQADNASFFSMPPLSSDLFAPIDRQSHKSLTVSQFLNRKLRWMTLGGQYNWTEKKYPHEDAPSFPDDIASFIRRLFPNLKPEAAILNVYSPGDTLSVHRDVSEESDKELVSISFGCDGIFIIGHDSDKSVKPEYVIVRLHSGDAVVMSGPARFAWHGVPRVIRNTCPASLCGWPATANDGSINRIGEDPYEVWRGWMSNKRINLNVRQMKE